MNTSVYTSSTIFSFIIIAIAIIILTAIAIYYLGNKLVKKRTARAVETSKLMQHAIDMSDHIIVTLDLKTNQFQNNHGHQLPAEAPTMETVRQLLHPDDVEAFDTFINELRTGEKQNNQLRYRFNTNYGDGEPVYHIVVNHAIVEYDLEGQPSVIICSMVDETEEARIRLSNDEMGEKYQALFEDSIIGISFYNADGYLIDCNRMMREICNFESRYDSVFFDSNIFDLATYPSVTREKVEEYWGCMKLENLKRNISKYLELSVHPINDSKGKLNYIVMVARDITEERDLYMQSRKNDKQIIQASQEIQRYEEQLHYLLKSSKMLVWRSTIEQGEIEFLYDLHHSVAKMSAEEFAQKLQTDEQEAAISRLTMTVKERAANQGFVTRPFKNLLINDDKVYWYNFNSIPSYDEQGRQTGYFGLVRDVTDLIEEQEKLKRETERANDSDRMKSVFLANMTHEIRTPLNAIVGFSDLLQAIEGPEEKREMMRIIRNNCDMLLRLINDFLATSTIDSNGVTLTPSDINFAQKFDDLCTSLAQRTNDLPVEFINDNPYTRLDTCLDMERIGQVVTNFVTNAIKYTPQGHIKVGYRVENRGRDGLYIYCEDTGAGIPKEDHGRIFDRFVKLNDYIQGTGLGLSICKAIVDCCEGQIGVDSEVGQGSTFWFWIPCEIKEQQAKA